MSVQIGHLNKDRLVKDMGGNIIDWYREAHGGWIIRGREIVNKEAWQKHLDIQKDKAEAAKAVGLAKSDANAPDRTVAPSKINDLEAKIDAMKKDTDTKFDAIMKALQK